MDKVDAHNIASIIMSDVNLNSNISYHNEEQKSLTHYCFDKVKELTKLKSSIPRLVCIMFPEQEKLVPSLHMASIYALLSEFPSINAVASPILPDLLTCFTVAPKASMAKKLPSVSETLPKTRLTLLIYRQNLLN